MNIPSQQHDTGVRDAGGRARGRASGDALWSVLQRALAGILLLVSTPALALAGLAVRLSSPGPVLFKQQRPGLGGRPFTVYKLRTMTRGSERMTRFGVSRTHPAITPVGKIIRDLKIDELPQLVNILRGEMRFVGPRPIPVPLDRALRERVPGFGRRYAVKPGLTCLAQICIHDNLVEDRLAEDWRMRLAADLHYLRHRCFWYDALVIGMTGLFLARRACSVVTGPSLRVPVRYTPGAAASTAVTGVPIANLDYAGVIERIDGWIQQPRGRMIGVCPVHSLMDALFNRAHRKALLRSDLNTADGMPVVWTQRLMGHRGASRVYGPTMMLKTLERAEAEGWRVAFFGGHPERLPVMAAKLKERYPALNMVEAISPPFGDWSKQTDDALTRRLADSKPDIVWVGLGAPKQEVWISEHLDRIPAVMVGVGAAFDFHAGAVRQAPAWIQRLGMEWAFRLAMEPRRLARRYARSNPLFVALVIRQLFERYALRRSFQLTPRGAAPPAALAFQPGGKHAGGHDNTDTLAA